MRLRASLFAATLALSPAFTQTGAAAESKVPSVILTVPAPVVPVGPVVRAQEAPDAGAFTGTMTEDEAAPPAEPPSNAADATSRDKAPGAHESRAAERGEHVVGPHDTLGGIAHHYGITTDALAKANGMTRLTRIRIGEHLVIPSPGEAVHTPARTHIVAKGNTIKSIARRYNVTVEALLDANHMRRSDRLHVDQKLVIPGSDGSVPAVVEETSEKAERDTPSEAGMQELPVAGSGPAYYYEPEGPGHSGMRPVIVYLHGRGADPKEYCQRWSRVARHLGWLICPSGPEDRGAGKRGWNNSWPAGRNIVMNAIEGLRKRYGRRVQLYGNTLIGFSEGAFVAMNVGLREPHTFNRWLILGADTDYWGAAGLATLPEAKGRVRRVYLITGGHDDVVDDAAKVRNWLTNAGVPVRVSTPKDMGHEVALETKPAMYQAALRWLAEG